MAAIRQRAPLEVKRHESEACEETAFTGARFAPYKTCAMITCGWCGVHYSTWQNRCDACGGAMPPRPGFEVGPQPPEAPRRLPHRYVFRRRWSRNILVLAGSSFFLAGAALTALLISAKSWGALFTLIFVLVGAGLFRMGWREASATLRAFRRGTAVVGQVVGVRIDTSQSINKDHPWILSYQFQAEGHQRTGSVTSWDSTVARRGGGQPIWVLYVPEDPAQNTPYPPL